MPVGEDEIMSKLAATLKPAYELDGELGGGGMSRVFTAMDTRLNRRCVVKVLAPELAVSLAVERFEREIMLCASLQHPNIVPVLGAGVVDGLPYYIMPFVEGESLRTRLARGPFSVREVVSILRDVMRALTYAHSRGVVHRDIKPDNVLLAGSAATVTDFGLAKAVSDSRGKPITRSSYTSTITRVGTSIGTPAYMAPEQAAGDPKLDHRADLYSLGIVAYEMLIGAPPFSASSPQQLLAAHLTERPPKIEARRYDVPSSLVALVNQLLEKDPDKRPKTAAEVGRMLDNPEFVSGTFATARPTTKKKPWLWIVVGAVLAAAAGTAYFLITSHSAK